MRALARRAAARTATALARRSAGRIGVPGTTGVVVTYGEQAGALAECLQALTSQDARVDVVALGVGDPGARARAVAERAAASDPGIRVLDPAPDLATARARGLAVSAGEFVQFLDPDHVPTAHGLATAARALRASGSDYALLGHRTHRRGHTFDVDDVVLHAHGTPATGTTAAETPALLSDTHAATAVLRRRWLRGLVRERGRAHLGDDLTLLALAASGGSCDVLDVVGVRLRALVDRRGPTVHPTDEDGLRATATAIRDGADLLGPDVAAAFTAHCLASRMQPYLDHAWYAGAGYWAALHAAVTPLLDRAGDRLAAAVPAHRQALLHLLAADDADGFRALLGGARSSAREHPTVATPHGVVVDFGGAATVPDEARTLADHERRARAEVREVRVHEDGVEVRGHAFLDNVPPSAAASLSLAWVAGDGRTVPAVATRHRDPLADRSSGLACADVTGRGFTATSALLPPGRWVLVATVEEDGVGATARAGVRPWVMAGMAPVAVAGRTWVVDHDDLQQLRLVVGGEAAATVVTGPPAAVTVTTPGHRPTTTDATALDPRRDHPVAAAAGTVALSGTDTALPGRRGGLVLRHPARCASVEEMRFAPGEAIARLRLGEAPGWRAALRLGPLEVPGTLAPLREGTYEARFRLRHDPWARGGACLPSGEYALSVRNDLATDWFVAAPDPAFLPREELQPDVRVRAEAYSPDRPGVRLVVAAPLADDELGARHQRLLRDAANGQPADRPSAFFRAMFGEHTTGNGLAVHDELRRRGSTLELLWAVADRSVPVPGGGTGVVERSREWYDAIARSRYHMVDVHQVAWLHGSPEQVVIQTMHGYPYKIMGHAWWRRLGNTIEEIANLDRRTRAWTYFVSPAGYATPLLREAFLDPAGAADVEVLETGYPRNDALLGPDRAATRKRTRELLGIAGDQVAVLYAPTFRDYLSAEDRTARAVQFFDPAAALAALPGNYVVLRRGHAFNARVRDDRLDTADRVVDVTDYPDVNDLMLASDAGVLDYSSLRFDYVLTGNPMVFLVPDLEEYDRHRGGVIPYAPTAPGPWTEDTAETAAWLADLPRLRAEYADARARFRAEYVELEDGRSAARLVDAVFVPRGDAAPA